MNESFHTLQLDFLFFDWLFINYTECIENIQCTLLTVPRMREVLLLRVRTCDAFLAHAPLSGAMSLWHTVASVFLSIQNFKMLLLEYALMEFCDTWIQQSSGRGTLGMFRTLGSKVI